MGEINLNDMFAEKEARVRRYCNARETVSLFTLMEENAITYADLKKIVSVLIDEGTLVEGREEDEFVVVPEGERISLKEKAKRRIETVVDEMTDLDVEDWIDKMKWRCRDEFERYCNEEEDFLSEHGREVLNAGVVYRENGEYVLDLTEDEYELFLTELRKKRMERVQKKENDRPRRGCFPFRSERRTDGRTEHISDDDWAKWKSEMRKTNLSSLLDDNKSENDDKDDYDALTALTELDALKDLMDDVDKLTYADSDEDTPLDTTSLRKANEGTETPHSDVLDAIGKTFEKADGKNKDGKADEIDWKGINPNVAEELRIAATRSKIIEDVKAFCESKKEESWAFDLVGSDRFSLACYGEFSITISGRVSERGTLVLCDDAIAFDLVEMTGNFGEKKKMYTLMEENGVFALWQAITQRTMCAKTIDDNYVEETEKFLSVMKSLSKLASET